jgi:hypothetical protein
LLTTIVPGAVVVNSAAAALVNPDSMPYGFSPAQIRQAYGFNQITFQNGTINGDGTGQTIAIVDAYDQPHMASDLAAFDAQFGLPAPPSFTKMNEFGGSTLPTASASWGVEESLDVEWAHAIAPGANIVLLEGNSPTVTDLVQAVNTARNLPGVSVVSMSFGGGEFYGENSYDSFFTTPSGHSGVTFIASSGDSGSAGAPEWPSVSPNVLAIGGTQLTTDASGDYVGETAWSGSGGGISHYESAPTYQHGVVTQSSTARTVPDVAYDGSTNSPFAIYDSSSYSGWIAVAGTSCGAPQWSALVAIADQRRALVGEGSLDGPTQLLPMIYSLPSAELHDVVTGNNGGYSALQGYDLVTGRGTPVANAVVISLLGPNYSPAKPTFTSLASSLNPGLYGMPVTFAARVSARGGATPAGTVAFMDGSVVLGYGTLTGGVAAYSTGTLPPGGNAIRAVYEGSATDAPSSSLPLFQLVFAAPTTVSVFATANPATTATGVELVAQVFPSASGGNAPSGTVLFVADGNVVGAATVSGGVATFSTSVLGAGEHEITAVYGGDGNYYGATSSAFQETVNAAPASENGSAPPAASGPSTGTTASANQSATKSPAAQGLPTAMADDQPAAAMVLTQGPATSTKAAEAVWTEPGSAWTSFEVERIQGGSVASSLNQADSAAAGTDAIAKNRTSGIGDEATDLAGESPAPWTSLFTANGAAGV